MKTISSYVLLLSLLLLLTACILGRDSALYDPAEASANLDPGRYANPEDDLNGHFIVKSPKPGHYNITVHHPDRDPWALVCTAHDLYEAVFVLQCLHHEGRSWEDGLNQKVMLFPIKRLGPKRVELIFAHKAVENWLVERLGPGPWIARRNHQHLLKYRLTGDDSFDKSLLEAYARTGMSKIKDSNRATLHRTDGAAE